MPSPPGEERAVADRVIAELRDLGLEVDEDDAGARIGSNAGNLYCRLAPTAEGTPLFLCAHLDTVPPVGPIEPVVEDGVVRNAGGTILGADNKSAVAAMVETARRLVEEGRPHAGLELVFTPKEEVGLRGAAAFDCARLAAPVGYVYDQAGPIGEVVLGAPYSAMMEVTFAGRAAHAGMAPEEGRSAIAAAGARDRRHAARPPRRGDDRERRHDRGRGRAQHRPRPLHVPRRGALARRGEARRRRPGDARRVHVRRVAHRLRGGDRGRARVQGLPVPQGRRAGSARARGARARRATSRRTRSPAAAPTRTSSTCAASPASTWRTGWRRSTRPQEHIAVADLEAMVEVTLALLEEARAA